MGDHQDRVRELFDRLAGEPVQAWEPALRAAPDAVANEVRRLLAHQGAVTGDMPTSRQPPREAEKKKPDLIGTTVGRYLVLEPLGEGGFGAVYKAEQREPIRRVVALKIIKPGMDSNDVLARFESERQALARMDHPNISRVLDAGTTEAGRVYFVMEFVPGEPVTTFADRHKLSLRQRLELFQQICSAIAHAHQKAIIHRDIKPGNVLAYYDSDQKISAKVIDFGIAKSMTGDKLTERTFNTARGMTIGTYESMSPEQADGSADIDTRSDVYSLGVLLYELLTGIHPFRDSLKDAIVSEIQRVIRDQEPARPSTRLTELGETAGAIARARQLRVDQLAHQLGSELEWIPLKAMRKERERRYLSVEQLSADVENYLSAKPLIAAPESRLYRLRKAARRHRFVLAAAASVALALVLGLAGTTYGLRSARAAQRIAEASERKAVDQADRADREAAISGAVNGFLTKLLKSPDPRSGAGKDVKVADLLQTASHDLQNWQEAPAAVRGSIEQTLGNSFQNLGLLDEAERNLRSALNRLEVAAPRNDHAIRRATFDLAGLLQMRSAYPESRVLFEQVIASDNDDSLTERLRDRVQYALLLQDTGTLDGARGVLDKVSAWPLDKADRDDHFDALAARASVQYASGQAEASIAGWQEVLVFAKSQYGPTHARVAETLSNLAVTLAASDVPQATRTMGEALEIQRKLLPAGHPDLALSLNNLGQLQQMAGDLPAAKRSLGEALSSQRKLYPNGHKDLAATLNNLGSLARAAGDTAEAAKCFREATEMYHAIGLSDAAEAKTAEENLNLVQDASSGKN